MTAKARSATAKSRTFGRASFTLNVADRDESTRSASSAAHDHSVVTNMDLSRWDPYYIRSLTRFSDKGVIPPLSPAQLEAAEVLEQTCNRLALHMILEVGDIQFLSDTHVFHARTAYTDHAPPAPKRQLMRLWLATPRNEGGWDLPFLDNHEKKRGGIQVDDTPPVAPLDAE